MQVSPGFATEHVLTGSIELPQARYPDGPQITAFYQTLLERLRQVPGIQAAGVTNNLPMTGSGSTTWLALEGRPRPVGEPPEVNYRTASPDYFRALDVPVIAGRVFTDQDTPTSLTAVIVNRTLVERFFSDRDPIGRRIRIGPNPKAPWRTIVGVVGDMHQAGPEVPALPELYLPVTQDVFADTSLAVRTPGDPLALAATLRDVVHSIDPQLAIIQMTTMEQIVTEHVASRRLLMILLAVFAGVALLLALVGIYGVMGNAVSQRTNEIGVRMALGAQRGEIVQMILREGAALGLAGLGLGLGIAIALAVTRLLKSALFGVTPTDVSTYASVVALMLVVGLVACYLPARRAAPLTLPSHTSILTGALPPEHGVRLNGVSLAGRPTVAAAFKDAGYRTGAFVGAYVLDRRFGLGVGFDTYDDRVQRDPTGAARLEAERRGDAVVDAALAWLARQDTRPFFTWIHLYDPHAPTSRRRSSWPGREGMRTTGKSRSPTRRSRACSTGCGRQGRWIGR
jgi:MacB-like periplasmic core domain/Sulfatase/FtsX-like permease family